MGETTEIAWCKHTFNSWEGCTKISAGCQNCYAATRDHRWTGGTLWGQNAGRRIASDSYWRQPFKWELAARDAGEPALVFAHSLSDVGERRDDLLDPKARLFATIALTPWLHWLVLTKRPSDLLWWLHRDETYAEVLAWADKLRSSRGWSTPDVVGGTPVGRAPLSSKVRDRIAHLGVGDPKLGYANIRYGVTVESQTAVHRIPEGLKLPNRNPLFISCEPLIAMVDVTGWLGETCCDREYIHGNDQPCRGEPSKGVGWVIAGGESGRGARYCDVGWIEFLAAQCDMHDTAFFCKQLGAVPAMSEAEWKADPKRLLSATTRDRVPAGLVGLKLNDAKGGNMTEFPEHLRVREFPKWRRPEATP